MCCDALCSIQGATPNRIRDPRMGLFTPNRLLYTRFDDPDSDDDAGSAAAGGAAGGAGAGGGQQGQAGQQVQSTDGSPAVEEGR